MGSNYSATEEQWAALEREAHYTAFNCILELRARIEALEAAQQQPAPATEESSATAALCWAPALMWASAMLGPTGLAATSGTTCWTVARAWTS